MLSHNSKALFARHACDRWAVLFPKPIVIVYTASTLMIVNENLVLAYCALDVINYCVVSVSVLVLCQGEQELYLFFVIVFGGRDIGPSHRRYIVHEQVRSVY